MPPVPAQVSTDMQGSLIELLIALTPAVSAKEHAPLLWRASRPNLSHPDAALQKKGYKALAALAEHQPSFLSTHLDEVSAALAEALPACHTASKRRRLLCWHAIVSRLSAEQLKATRAPLLGEVVLATKESNVKSRAAAFDALLLIAERAQKLSSEEERPEALSNVFVSVAAGLAGKTPHMVAASLLALSRLFYEHRDSASAASVGLRLFETVLPLLRHREQEVVRAAVVLIKVQLSALPKESLQPLLPRLVPPLLSWCSNKHAHLKYQVRYLIERMVKRFGLEVMYDVTPEPHTRLLTHMRKQKERARRHTDARLAAKAEREAAAADDDEEARGPRNRHAEYEALLGEGDEEEHDGEDDAYGGARANRDTFRDTDEGATAVDLLTAPLVQPAPLRQKRRREAARGEDGENDDGVSFAEGKVRVATATSADAAGAVADTDDVEMEVDPEDEIVRAGKVAKRVQTGSIRRQVAVASKAEEAERPPPTRTKHTLSRRGDATHARTTFGANFGDSYRSKKGGKGDVMRPGALQPHAYLPLNPRMLGRKNKRSAAETTAKLVAGGRKNKARGRR